MGGRPTEEGRDARHTSLVVPLGPPHAFPTCTSTSCTRRSHQSCLSLVGGAHMPRFRVHSPSGSGNSCGYRIRFQNVGVVTKRSGAAEMGYEVSTSSAADGSSAAARAASRSARRRAARLSRRGTTNVLNRPSKSPGGRKWWCRVKGSSSGNRPNWNTLTRWKSYRARRQMCGTPISLAGQSVVFRCERSMLGMAIS